MRKFIAAAFIAVGLTAAVAVPAQAHVTHPSLRDTNWPCAGC